ncbi:MAG: type IV pilus biogenesis protein PilP [Alphaproteobacteria bacterium]|nr:type IV pilus biogenesis protein PilP [Alphaproteobacteria bacterium]
MRIANKIFQAKTMVVIGVGAVFLTGLCLSPRDAWARLDRLDSLEKKISTMEDEAIVDAKEKIDQLSQEGDETTLADLNQARQAASRIDAMIDLERRLIELQKLRGNRRGGGSSASASFDSKPAMALDAVLPANALAVPLPIRSASLPVDTPAPVKKASSDLGRPDILRISGAGGRYTALLKFSNGDMRAVKVGDRLSDEETIRSITASSVRVGGKGGGYTLQIKNVDVVFSAAR